MLGPVVSQALGRELAGIKVVSDLLASFRTQRPRRPPSLPDWDVTFVLYQLTKAPFEPMEHCSVKLLTLKTFFLLLLASARRRSDVHAIDVDRTEFRADGAVVLFPSRDFVPKTRAAMEGHEAFSPIVLPPLGPAVGTAEPDALLCPVRALRIYLERTRPFRQGRKRLFISYQTGRTSDITRQTLSGWVKCLVQYTYKFAGVDARRLYRISAHQVRHIGVSLASATNVNLETLVRAGMWSNSTTFTNFYLSNATTVIQQSGRFRLGPLVAAQAVVGVSR